MVAKSHIGYNIRLTDRHGEERKRRVHPLLEDKKPVIASEAWQSSKK